MTNFNPIDLAYNLYFRFIQLANNLWYYLNYQVSVFGEQFTLLEVIGTSIVITLLVVMFVRIFV